MDDEIVNDNSSNVILNTFSRSCHVLTLLNIIAGPVTSQICLKDNNLQKGTWRFFNHWIALRLETDSRLSNHVCHLEKGSSVS